MLGDWDLDGLHWCQLPRSCPSYKILIIESCCFWSGVPGISVGKESSCSTGDLSLISGSGRSPGEGNGNPLQYSCLENPVDRTWQSIVHGVARVGHDLATKPPPPRSSPFCKILVIETYFLW